jgi:hypothetical protein
MVEQLDVEGLGRVPELPGHLHIGRARCRVTGWVIVDTGDSGCSMLDCTPEHLPWMCQCRGRRARGNLDQFLESILPVEA